MKKNPKKTKQNKTIPKKVYANKSSICYSELTPLPHDIR